MNRARRAEFDNYPIVTWPTTSFRFPAVAHVRRSSRHDQIMTMAKKHVAAREYEPAILNRSEIDVAPDAFETIPIGRHFAKYSQSRYAAIGINLQTQMSKALLTLDCKKIL